MSNTTAIAIVAAAVVSVVALIKLKPAKAAEPGYRKMDRNETHEKAMKYARSQNYSSDYNNVMDIMGQSVDFSNSNPAYERA